jgi:hypothetical protein
MNYCQDCDSALLVVDAVDDAIGAAAGAVSISQWRLEPLAYPLRVVQQRADDELIRSHRHGFRWRLGKLPAGGGCDDQPVLVGSTHAVRLRRRMASASCIFGFALATCDLSLSLRQLPHGLGVRQNGDGLFQ